MAKQMIWLLGYISLGFALTLGNRPAINTNNINNNNNNNDNNNNNNNNQRTQMRLSRYETHRPRSTDGMIAGPGSASQLSTFSLMNSNNKNRDSNAELDYRYPRYSRYSYGRESVPYDVPPSWIQYNDQNNHENDGEETNDENLWNFSKLRRQQISSINDIDEDDDNDDDNNNNNNNNNNGKSSLLNNNNNNNNNNNIIMDDFASAVLETLYPSKQSLRINNLNNKVDNINNKINGYTIREKEGLAGTSFIGKSENALPVKLQNDIFKKNKRLFDKNKNNNNNINSNNNNNNNDMMIELTDGKLPLKDTSLLWGIDAIDKFNNPWNDDHNDALRSHNDGVYERKLKKRNHLPDGRRRGSTSSKQQESASLPSLPAAVGGMASQFMLRAARGNRQYDVPQIECPSSEDGMERFACPTPDRMGRYRCIDDHVLCDGFIDCPTGEDEDRQACMFYKTTKAHLDVLADALLRWVRGR